MNRYAALGCLGLGLMMSPLLGAIGNTAVPANPKIGVINIEDTLSSTPAGKRANEAFEKTRKTKQGLLDRQQEDLKKADADLVKQKAVLKPEVFDAKRQELEKKFVDLQQTYVKLERELAQDRTKLIQDLLKQAEPKIAAIAKAEGVSLILDQSATAWADPAVDLTQKSNAEMKCDCRAVTRGKPAHMAPDVAMKRPDPRPVAASLSVPC
jgi:outer membrane protein